MKRCPECGRTYTETDINFCLDDGELLMLSAVDAPERQSAGSPFNDDTPPTLVISSPRETNPGTWSAYPAAGTQSQDIQRQVGTAYLSGPRDTTLPTIALALAITSVFFLCCYGGIWLGLPAAVVGFLGMRNADNDPGRYGGRGLAIGGMIIGIVTFLVSVVFLLGLLSG